MKTQIVKDEKVFKPVVVQITCETLEELDMLQEIAGFNESIPELVTRKNTANDPRYKLCQDILTSIHRAVIRYDGE